MKVSPVQKQTSAGQRTRFKAVVVVGDSHGHIGVGSKVSGEVANAIRAATTLAKLSVVPVRLGWWGARFGPAHTVPMKVQGKCGSVRFRLIPAPRGTGLVAANASKKILQMTGVTDCFTSSTGKTKTVANFVKAAYAALAKTSSFLSPDQWAVHEAVKSPFDANAQFLKEGGKGGKKSKKV